MRAAVDDVAAFFDALALGYDADGSHARTAAALVALVSPARRPGLVIDAGAGCGQSAFAVLAAWETARVLAVDVSQQMLAAGRALSPSLDLRQRVGWVRASALPLPVPDGSADVVLYASCLHFLGAPALADGYRVLRPGGSLGFTVAATDSFHPSPAARQLMPAGGADLPGSVEGAAALARSAGFAAVRAAAADVGEARRPRRVVLVAATRP